MMKQQLLRHPALKLSTLALLLLTAGASQAATTPDVTQVNMTLSCENAGPVQTGTMTGKKFVNWVLTAHILTRAAAVIFGRKPSFVELPRPKYAGAPVAGTGKSNL